jgi:V8-like Glu-specific endopeptidase
MYHNLVTYSDDKIVQYLTDTEPGSSGSPVFNSQWQVVALHHSGGMLEDPVSKKLLLRNEGININLVIEGIKANNL